MVIITIYVLQTIYIITIKLIYHAVRPANEMGFTLRNTGFETCFGWDRCHPAPKVLGSYTPKTSALSRTNSWDKHCKTHLKSRCCLQANVCRKNRGKIEEK